MKVCGWVLGRCLTMLPVVAKYFDEGPAFEASQQWDVALSELRPAKGNVLDVVRASASTY